MGGGAFLGALRSLGVPSKGTVEAVPGAQEAEASLGYMVTSRTDSLGPTCFT